MEINCADEALLAEAVATFHAVTPVTRTDVVDGSVLYIPVRTHRLSFLLRPERRSLLCSRKQAIEG